MRGEGNQCDYKETRTHGQEGRRANIYGKKPLQKSSLQELLNLLQRNLICSD